MKILIVDDSAIVRRAIQNYLGPFGLQVVGEAGSGTAAIERFLATRPDLVTLDITMPEMDGLQCLQELLRIEAGVRVLVITALSDQATALQALRMGARGFLPKPFTPDQLSIALKRVLS